MWRVFQFPVKVFPVTENAVNFVLQLENLLTLGKGHHDNRDLHITAVQEEAHGQMERKGALNPGLDTAGGAGGGEGHSLPRQVGTCSGNYITDLHASCLFKGTKVSKMR